ncbi:MAG: hypothetical protein AVDCRST_MAG65-1239 [uncultured Solirubrobacteraceae bacterium]|uniref:Uncharacterized protein n=1 Tax=uncultured Solirubrobacteraceae bacterium TaxID=1162706 RepID=A0A6J4RN30_9ACTN|nr:MAG: hypothetical protein AVDCRST_MAG65-1239 [uncultured Solirubrobacteraceae bacterium]
METTREADSGYPEENPAELKQEDAGPPEKSSVRESASANAKSEAGVSNDDGTATGNPDAAGAQPKHDR